METSCILSLFLLMSLLHIQPTSSKDAYTDPECSSYDHSTYGCVGQCVSTSSCPGSNYISNLCPSQGANIKCCFTADTDDECLTYDHSTYGQVGHCISTGQCPSSNYISNLCPSQPGDVKCCFSKGSCSAGSLAACQIYAMHQSGQVYLLDNNGYLNSKGNNDGADALSNIRDTCNGGSAKRSSYSCSSGSSPGGSVGLSERVLQYILDVANSGKYERPLQVNAIAGACHSTTSWHYQGTAVDFQIKSGDSSSDYSYWMSVCSSQGARENLGPGSPGHSTHTHCAFSS